LVNSSSVDGFVATGSFAGASGDTSGTSGDTSGVELGSCCGSNLSS